jgi:hypothetical protein
VHGIHFPTLAPLSRLQVTELQVYCSQRKGLTFDGFSDVWVKNTQCFDLLADLWNQSSINQLSLSFEARLVPLNKLWPDIVRKNS